VDLRDREAYADGHIPGAVHLDLADLGETRDGCENALLQPLDFERVMERLEIANGNIVVAYDDHWGLPSARLLWALHYYGERSVGVLNGGWDLWQEEGRPMAGGPAPGEPGSEERASDRASRPAGAHFAANPNPDVAADYGSITLGLGDGKVVLLDTRSPSEFEQGHLPEAISWDWFSAVPAESWACSRDPGEIRSELEKLGVRTSDEIVAYCRSGMRAAHTYVVLRHAGFERARLYDGSWQEWSMRA
jgi:thiosulfate/3-mercaptopyruvate sulfurtransferase